MCFFVHSAFTLHALMTTERRQCRNYMMRIISMINAPIASNQQACRTLANILLKAFVLDNSDREREFGCLRRREKLPS